MGEPWPRAALAPFAALPPGTTPGLAPTAGLRADPAAGEDLAADATSKSAENPAAAALALFAQLLAADSLDAAAHRLTATLARDFGLRRATLALHERGRTTLRASSNLDLTRAQAELPQLLLGALDEAIEQARAVSWPAADGGDTTISLEQRLLQRHVGGATAALPLGAGGEVFAALCVERDGDAPFAAAELVRLQQLLQLATPALRWMHHAQQPWHRRAWREGLQALARWRQPRHRVARRVAAGAALALAVLALVPFEREVTGRARVEGAEQRVLSAPADGFVKAAHVRPGDRVKAGQPLVDLLDADLQLERERWGSQLAQHDNGYAAAMAKSDRAQAAVSLSRGAEARSQLALVDEQLLRGRVVAPFDALVVQGDLSQAIGAPVRQGDTLLTLAAVDRYRVIVEVDETDIARVQTGQSGQLALSSLPWDHEALVVERIAPLAKAVDGRNVFEVEARLLDPGAELRPGLLGRAGLVVGRMPPLWVWTRQALDRLRVAWWSWLG